MKSLAKNCFIFFILIAVNLNCQEEEATKEVFCNDPLFPYFCPLANKCCSLPFYGKQLNKCYATIGECGKAGQSCESCTIEAKNTNAANYIYVNWNCAGSSTCEVEMGGSSGTAGPFCDTATCTAWGEKFIPGGYSCSDTPSHSPNIGSPPDGVCFKTSDF